MTKKSPRKNTGISLLVMQQREVGAAEFKAHCLEIMDEVERLGTEVTITKHRKPVARLVPVAAPSGPFCGSLRGLVVSEGDLVSPIDVVWGDDDADLA